MLFLKSNFPAKGFPLLPKTPTEGLSSKNWGVTTDNLELNEFPSRAVISALHPLTFSSTRLSLTSYLNGVMHPGWSPSPPTSTLKLTTQKDLHRSSIDQRCDLCSSAVQRCLCSTNGSINAVSRRYQMSRCVFLAIAINRHSGRLREFPRHAVICHFTLTDLPPVPPHLINESNISLTINAGLRHSGK